MNPKLLFDPKKPPVVVVFVVGTLAPHIPIFEFGSPNFVFVLSCPDTPKLPLVLREDLPSVAGYKMNKLTSGITEAP